VTSKERMANALQRQWVDHIPVVINPWETTIRKWRQEHHIGPDEDVYEHFDQDLRTGGWINSIADPDFTPLVLEETEETILTLDGNGAKLRRPKKHEGTPEHVDFTVKDRQGWLQYVKPHLLDVNERRLPMTKYQQERSLAQEKQRFFCWAGIAPFEQIHPMCGHEHMLMGMALDADWIKDMVLTYARFTIAHLETLFSKAGKPDGVYFFEDMGFKLRPFMSPAMYREIVQPGHKLLFDFSHSQNLPVIVHSCGFVEPLVPGLIAAGMDCLQAMEVKAGMDLLRLFRQYGDRIAFFGGMDTRTLISNDLDRIEEELQRKIPPILENGGGYILHSDHSEPPEVEYATMRFFVDRGREIGRGARGVKAGPSVDLSQAINLRISE